MSNSSNGLLPWFSHANLSQVSNVNTWQATLNLDGATSAEASLDYLQELVKNTIHFLTNQIVTSDETLMEGSLTSFQAGQLCDSLGEALCQECPPTMVYDYPTVRSIAAFVKEFSDTTSIDQDRHAVPVQPPYFVAQQLAGVSDKSLMQSGINSAYTKSMHQLLKHATCLGLGAECSQRHIEAITRFPRNLINDAHLFPSSLKRKPKEWN